MWEFPLGQKDKYKTKSNQIPMPFKKAISLERFGCTGCCVCEPQSLDKCWHAQIYHTPPPTALSVSFENDSQLANCGYRGRWKQKQIPFQDNPTTSGLGGTCLLEWENDRVHCEKARISVTMCPYFMDIHHSRITSQKCSQKHSKINVPNIIGSYYRTADFMATKKLSSRHSIYFN